MFQQIIFNISIRYLRQPSTFMFYLEVLNTIRYFI